MATRAIHFYRPDALHDAQPTVSKSVQVQNYQLSTFCTSSDEPVRTLKTGNLWVIHAERPSFVKRQQNFEQKLLVFSLQRQSKAVDDTDKHSTRTNTYNLYVLSFYSVIYSPHKMVPSTASAKSSSIGLSQSLPNTSFLSPPEGTTNTPHHDPFCRFCTSRDHDQRTDRLSTDDVLYSNRLHIAHSVMSRNNFFQM